MPPLKRRWVFPAGAGLGWALALFVGTLLDGELQTLRLLFMPLSALAGGLAALAAWTHFGSLADTSRDVIRRWRLRTFLAVLALGTTCCLGCTCGFRSGSTMGIPHQSVAYLVGWSRSGLCECSGDDASCIQEMGLAPGRSGPAGRTAGSSSSSWRSPIS